SGAGRFHPRRGGSMSDSEAKPAIWYRPFTVGDLNAAARGTMVEHLGITFLYVGSDHLSACMPDDNRTRQPYGLLHGGASVALAETLGSMAATCCVDADRYFCVGIEVNANHLKAVRGGTVTGVARPLHLGRRTHVWEIKLTDDAANLVCVSRLTLAVLERP